MRSNTRLGLAIWMVGLGGCSAEVVSSPPGVGVEDRLTPRGCKDLVKTFDVENGSMGNAYGDCLPGGGAGGSGGGVEFGTPTSVPSGPSALPANSDGFLKCSRACEDVVLECLSFCVMNPDSTGRTELGKVVKFQGKTYGSVSYYPSYTPGVKGEAALGMCQAQCVLLRPQCIVDCVPVLTYSTTP